MLSGLRFETAPPPGGVAPERTDIACFIGHVARRPGAPLLADVRAALTAAGWIAGPWAPDAAVLESLEQIPVSFDSWDAFARLFAWERRPLGETGDARCATYLGAAVRSFFATGGRRAVVLRVADPFPYIEAGGGRAAHRDARLAALVPAVDPAALPFDPTDPGTWRGIQHLYGLPEVSHLCLPDLPDICAADPLAPPAAFTPPPPPEVFVECSETEAPLAEDLGLRRLAAPRTDEAGFIAWRRAASRVCDFLARHRREALFAAALPLPLADAHQDGTHAQADLLAFLRGVGALEAAGSREPANGTAASAFAQILWPWLRSLRSDDLPQSLEPADGLFAGLLARNALVRGTFRSVAGTILDDIIGLTPLPAMGLGPDSPTERLAERLCLIAPEPEGMAVQSDVTTSPVPAWRFGGSSRLLAAILRAARHFGEGHAFEPNGPALWAKLRRTTEDLLEAFRREGAFGGSTAAEAYQVRCDRGTMSQNDLDNGRLIAEITVLPAASITRITVVLNLLVGESTTAEIREVA
jgi:Bacteriophage tail sheath protein